MYKCATLCNFHLMTLKLFPSLHTATFMRHTRTLLAGNEGWKRNPARADPFTGKSAVVMAARRRQAAKSLVPKRPEQSKKILAEANLEFSPPAALPSPFKISEDQHMSDVSNLAVANSVAVDFIDHMVHSLRRIFSATNLNKKIFAAARTKPIKKPTKTSGRENSQETRSIRKWVL